MYCALIQAQNESIKLKKRRDSQINDINKIVPGLLSLVIEEFSEDYSHRVSKEIGNYEELALSIKNAVISEYNLKLIFTFKEEADASKETPTPKKIKSRFP